MYFLYDISIELFCHFKLVMIIWILVQDEWWSNSWSHELYVAMIRCTAEMRQCVLYAFIDCLLVGQYSQWMPRNSSNLKCKCALVGRFVACMKSIFRHSLCNCHYSIFMLFVLKCQIHYTSNEYFPEHGHNWNLVQRSPWVHLRTRGVYSITLHFIITHCWDYEMSY